MPFVCIVIIIAETHVLDKNPPERESGNDAKHLDRPFDGRGERVAVVVKLAPSFGRGEY